MLSGSTSPPPPLIDWLDYNGYTVVTKATKEFVDQTGRRKVKGNMDIELAVDAMEIAGCIDSVLRAIGTEHQDAIIGGVKDRVIRFMARFPLPYKL